MWEHIKELQELLKYFPDIEEVDIPDCLFMQGYWQLSGEKHEALCSKMKEKGEVEEPMSQRMN